MRFRLIVPAIFITVSALLGGCGGSQQLPVSNAISGVYSYDVENLFGEGKASIALTFDENGSDLDGGVRIMRLHPSKLDRKKGLHSITERSGNHIEGQVDLGAPYGVSTFEGDLSGKDFAFTLTTSLGAVSGVAHRIGNYRRSSRIDWTWDVNGNTDESFDSDLPFLPVMFTISSSNVRSDNMGGLDFTAQASYLPPGYPMVNGQGEDLGGQVSIWWHGTGLDGFGYTNFLNVSPTGNMDDFEASFLAGGLTITRDNDADWWVMVNATVSQPD